MLEDEVTSSWRRVMLGRCWRWVSLERKRAVAFTWRPWLWKEVARAEPALPELQPVMRTVLVGVGGMVVVVELKLIGKWRKKLGKEICLVMEIYESLFAQVDIYIYLF